MKFRALGAVAVAATLAFTVAACGDDEPTTSGGGGGGEATQEATKAKVGVILPDAASSARWETADRKFLGEAFEAAGVESDIQNANGDKAKFATIADQMLNDGANVLLIVNLDSPSAAAVINKAKQQGVPVIDYDRLTLGGGAALLRVLRQRGRRHRDRRGPREVHAGRRATRPARSRCSTARRPTTTPRCSSRATRRRSPTRGYTVADDQSVPDWDNTKAGTIFEQMFTKAKGDFVGVAAANDGLGGAVAAVLKRDGASEIPTTGQDATDEGLQRVLLGTQCVTVYKAIKKEADAAAQLAIALAKGDTAGADKLATGQVEDTETKQQVKSVLLEPQQITKENVKDVVADGFTTADKICTTEALKKACEENGVSG